MSAEAEGIETRQGSREGGFGKSRERWDLVSLVTEEEVATAVAAVVVDKGKKWAYTRDELATSKSG